MYVYIYTYLYVYIHMYTYIHIHIHIYIHACVYLYMYTCRYVHIRMSIHAHTYTRIRTHMQHVHMHTCKHAWIDNALATARGTDTDARSSTRLFRSTHSTISNTSPPMLGLDGAHFLIPQYPSTPHPTGPSFQHTPEQFADRGERSFTVPH